MSAEDLDNYETDAELALLNQLWALVMARKNHLLPA